MAVLGNSDGLQVPQEWPNRVGIARLQFALFEEEAGVNRALLLSNDAVAQGVGGSPYVRWAVPVPWWLAVHCTGGLVSEGSMLDVRVSR